MSRPRLMRLLPWVIRAMIPSGLIGTYILHRDSSPVYVGRSDTDLRRRLLEHSVRACDEYFTYDVHFTREQAFEVECSLFHALRPAITNVLHPDRPDHLALSCPFCLETLADVLDNRLYAGPSVPRSEPETLIPASRKDDRDH